MSERERRLDAIREYAERLAGIADGYDRLRWMAEKETVSDAFIVLAEAAGMLTVDSLQQLGNLLEILRSTEVKNTTVKGK